MGSHISNEEETRNLRLEVDHLHRKLHCKQRMTSPPSSGSESGEDSSYRPQPRTPHSESFSYKEERYHKQRSKSLTHRSLGNDAISRALHHISKSPFTRKTDRAKLPCQFAQPTFTIYNRRTNPVEHVSHFNQRMVLHSRNEALMCKVFSSSLGPVAIRWFDGLDEGSIVSFQSSLRLLEPDLLHVAGFLVPQIPYCQW